MVFSGSLTPQGIKDLLVRNWMTHDALWCNEVANQFGMVVASPMNLKICRNLGQIEYGRLMKMVQASSPKDMEEYRALFELGKSVFFPNFMTAAIEYPENDTQVFHFIDCFAYKGMKKVGRLPDYECGIFERVEGWFHAMDLTYTRTPDLSRCLKYLGKDCRITVRFQF
jgi:hypothetical protein